MNRLTWIVFALVIGFFSALPVGAKPDKKRPEREPEPKKPLMLFAQCQWGDIKQDGLKVEITGSSHWVASGQLTEDRKRLIVTWTRLSDGRLFTGIYRVDVMKGELVGAYTLVGDEQIDQDGLLVNASYERLYKTPVPVEPPDGD